MSRFIDTRSEQFENYEDGGGDDDYSDATAAPAPVTAAPAPAPVTAAPAPAAYDATQALTNRGTAPLADVLSGIYAKDPGFFNNPALGIQGGGVGGVNVQPVGYTSPGDVSVASDEASTQTVAREYAFDMEIPGAVIDQSNGMVTYHGKTTPIADFANNMRVVSEVKDAGDAGTNQTQYFLDTSTGEVGTGNTYNSPKDEGISGFIKGILPIVLIAVNVVAPGLGAAIGASLLPVGASAAAAAAVGAGVMASGATLLAGGSPADALKAGLLAGVMPSVTSTVGGVLAPATSGLGTVAQNAITSAVSSAVKAVVTGQDVGAALVSGGLGSLAGSAAGALNAGSIAAKALVDQGLISTPQEIAAVTAGFNNTIGKMVGAGLTGGDVGGAAASGLVSTAVNAYNPAGEMGLTNKAAVAAVNNLITTAITTGNLNPITASVVVGQALASVKASEPTGTTDEDTGVYKSNFAPAATTSGLTALAPDTAAADAAAAAEAVRVQAEADRVTQENAKIDAARIKDAEDKAAKAVEDAAAQAQAEADAAAQAQAEADAAAQAQAEADAAAQAKAEADAAAQAQAEAVAAKAVEDAQLAKEAADAAAAAETARVTAKEEADAAAKAVEDARIAQETADAEAARAKAAADAAAAAQAEADAAKAKADADAAKAKADADAAAQATADAAAAQAAADAEAAAQAAAEAAKAQADADAAATQAAADAAAAAQAQAEADAAHAKAEADAAKAVEDARVAQEAADAAAAAQVQADADAAAQAQADADAAAQAQADADAAAQAQAEADAAAQAQAEAEAQAEADAAAQAQAEADAAAQAQAEADAAKTAEEARITQEAADADMRAAAQAKVDAQTQLDAENAAAVQAQAAADAANLSNIPTVAEVEPTVPGNIPTDTASSALGGVTASVENGDITSSSPLGAAALEVIANTGGDNVSNDEITHAQDLLQEATDSGQVAAQNDSGLTALNTAAATNEAATVDSNGDDTGGSGLDVLDVGAANGFQGQDADLVFDQYYQPQGEYADLAGFPEQDAENERMAQEEAYRNAENERMAQEEAYQNAENERMAQEEAYQNAENERMAQEEAYQNAENERMAQAQAEADWSQAQEAEDAYMGALARAEEARVAQEAADAEDAAEAVRVATAGGLDGVTTNTLPEVLVTGDADTGAETGVVTIDTGGVTTDTGGVTSGLDGVTTLPEVLVTGDADTGAETGVVTTDTGGVTTDTGGVTSGLDGVTTNTLPGVLVTGEADTSAGTGVLTPDGVLGSGTYNTDGINTTLTGGTTSGLTGANTTVGGNDTLPGVLATGDVGTGAGTGVVISDGGLGSGTYNTLPPVSVTGTTLNVLDPVSVTGTGTDTGALTTDTGGTATIDPRTGTNTLPTVSTTGETLNVLDPVSVTGTSTGVLTTDGKTIGTIPKIEPKLDTSTPVVRVQPKAASSAANAKKSTPDTGGGLPVSQDVRTVGKSGTMYTPQALTQLYDKLTQNNAQMMQPVAYDTEVIANSPLADYQSAYNTEGAYGEYAQGGTVQHFKEGGDSTDSSTSTEGLTPRQAANMIRAATADREQAAQYSGIQKSLANLGAITGPTPQRPNVAMVNRGAATQYEPRVLPQLAALLQSRGMKLAGGGDVNDENPEGLADQAHPNYDGTPTFRTGGLEGLGGKYVEGKGNGTSDDITAMLANGEYVFSADVVAALGNGSNKSGAQELDKMVEAIRKRARSAPPDKLSPDAKPPLEYLKSTKTQRG